MSLTVTTIVPGVPVGEGLKMGIYSVAWDNSYPTGGEALDLTADFDYVYGITVGGNDTLADNGYHIGALFTYGTAITSSNVLLTVHWEKNPGDSGGADIAFPEYTNGGTALADLGQTMITVWGN